MFNLWMSCTGSIFCLTEEDDADFNHDCEQCGDFDTFFGSFSNEEEFNHLKETEIYLADLTYETVMGWMQ